MLSLRAVAMNAFGLKRIVDERLDRTARVASNVVNRLTDAVCKGGLFTMIVVTIVWVSVFLYVAFYHAYIPSLMYSRPVHMQFKSCHSEKSVCDYPSSHIKLAKNNQLLMVGQKYKFVVEIELPESPVNEQIGMFTLCIRLSDKYGYLVSSSCRSDRLKYRSNLYRMVHTLCMIPFYLTGLSEEKQIIKFDMYTDFEDDQLHPVSDIYFELLDHDIQIYSAKIKIIANLSGIRYLMFHWPILSSFLGIGSNLLFVFFVFSMSWKHIYGSELYKNKTNDILVQCEQLDEFVSDNESDSAEEEMFKKANILPFDLSEQ